VVETVEVDVVGRLVEEEHVEAVEEQRRKSDASRFASRQHAGRTPEEAGIDAEIGEYLTDAGVEIGTAEGQAAARSIAIELLGTLQAAVGDLERVRRIVKVMSLVNSVPTFTEQHLVTNGCSELLVQVFGPAIGAHARSAFGVAQIPLGACVEIEMIAEVA